MPASFAITFVEAVSYPCKANSFNAAFRIASLLLGSKFSSFANFLLSLVHSIYLLGQDHYTAIYLKGQ